MPIKPEYQNIAVYWRGRETPIPLAVQPPFVPWICNKGHRTKSQTHL